MMLARQAIEGEGLFDRFLAPADELWIARAPFGDPCGQVDASLLDRASVVEPAQLLQAIVIGLARQMVEGVAQEVDVASLEGGFGEDFAHGRAQSGMIIGDDELDPMQASLFEGEEEVFPG
jgi:hypothetical protein